MARNWRRKRHAHKRTVWLVGMSWGLALVIVAITVVALQQRQETDFLAEERQRKGNVHEPAQGVPSRPTSGPAMVQDVPPPRQESAVARAGDNAGTPETANHSTPRPTDVTPVHATPADVTVASRDGSQVFGVPKPGDPEYADYLEMLQHPKVRSSAQGSPGYALPYDPEWRSMNTGRRAAKPLTIDLVDAQRSLDVLAKELLDALRTNDADGLLRLCVTRQEFESLLWPEFPQSRPYLRIPAAEAWSFHHSQCWKGLQTALEQLGGRSLELIEVQSDDTFEYKNFRMLRNIVVRVRDLEDNTTRNLEFAPAVIDHNGQHKFYIYAG